MQRHSPMAFLIPVLLFFQGVSIAWSSIPARYDGFPYGENWGIADGIIVESFFDPLCPDSRDTWPPLKQVLLEYHPRISLLVHPFPLPYHDNSFVACRALHIANTLNVSATYPLLELFFKYQEKYYNGPTKNLSREAIVDDISRLGAEAVGSSLLPEFKNGFIDSHSDSATRTSFKYGCTRGVFGTPFFFVNGFLLPNAGSAIDYETWKSVIERLVRNHEEEMGDAVSSI
ncbi:uncharacterized protein LOC110033475 [Phalaenopsis equestris]|uniref:uncharacterized protein LOC110033475 n=1 Tax=Phalaenopsis equestris TaxID=78828 RepID=UPI0009E5BD9C|nr:uncharacterized protein LOC110033475 [Phalaenopsis equestris]